VVLVQDERNLGVRAGCAEDQVAEELISGVSPRLAGHLDDLTLSWRSGLPCHGQFTDWREPALAGSYLHLAPFFSGSSTGLSGRVKCGVHESTSGGKAGGVSMQFAIFGSAEAASERSGTALGQGFHDFIELNVEAEALGYRATFLVEHHFSGWNQVSATLQLLTWLAARTTTLRLGTAVLVLPWHNPVLLAEQAAMLDLLSGGRLDFGIGKGYRHTEFEGFCIPPEQAQARFDEALDLLVKAWTTRDRFSHEGYFWHFKNIVVEPPPAQTPHPPLWTAAASPASIRLAARRGHHLILDQFASVETLGERIALFRSEVEAHGRRYDPLQVVVARDLFLVDNEREKEAAIERNNRIHARTLSVSRAPGRAGGSHVLAYAHTTQQQRESPLIGMPDEVLARLQALSAAGVEYVMLNPTGSRENLRRFAREVMSHAAALGKV
jgi:alkanesulfonate monooxygenase SsuD/methylene tetrahydromethanopterin reductase-like flavin-dependent oxidoreductase (luciferase family)